MRFSKNLVSRTYLYLLMALASLVFSMKRAVIVSFVLCFLAMIMIKPRILALKSLPFILIPFLFLIGYTPKVSSHFIGRIESIATETKGFTSGQARESEVLSILKHLEKTNSYILGSGIGATYDYFDYRGGLHKNLSQ